MRLYSKSISAVCGTIMCCVTIFFCGAAWADTALSFGMLQQEAENAYEQRNYKLAEDSLNQAFDSKSSDARDIELARARILLARIYKDTGRPQKSSEQLELAEKIYHRLGLTAPNLNGFSQSQLRTGDVPYVPSTVIAPAGIQIGAPVILPTGRTVTRTFTQSSGTLPATQMQKEIDKGIESIGKDMNQLEKDMDADARAAEAAVDAVPVPDGGMSTTKEVAAPSTSSDSAPAEAMPENGPTIDAPPMEESGGDDSPGGD